MSIELHIHIVAYACSHLPSEHQPTIKRSWFVTHALDEASTDLEFKLDNDIKAVLSGINDLVAKDQYHLAINSVLFSAATLQRRDGKPNLPYDDKTTKDCTYWIDYDGSQECMVMLEEDWVTLEQFIRWNPSIGPECSSLTAGNSYCVEALFEAPPGASSGVASSTPTPTSSKAPSGVQTPSPIQSGMTSSCKKFDFVNSGEICDTITRRNGISLADFVKWNTGVGLDCRSMWAETYICVGV